MNVEQRCVRVRLSSAEGLSILVLAQNGSFRQSAVGTSAVDKVRDALVRAGFEDDAVVEIDCTEDEALFVEQARQA